MRFTVALMTPRPDKISPTLVANVPVIYEYVSVVVALINTRYALLAFSVVFIASSLSFTTVNDDCVDAFVDVIRLFVYVKLPAMAVSNAVIASNIGVMFTCGVMFIIA